MKSLKKLPLFLQPHVHFPNLSIKPLNVPDKIEPDCQVMHPLFNVKLIKQLIDINVNDNHVIKEAAFHPTDTSTINSLTCQYLKNQFWFNFSTSCRATA